jgi:hypothetical protein
LRQYLTDVETTLGGLSRQAVTELHVTKRGVETLPGEIDTGVDRTIDTVAYHFWQRLTDYPLQANRLAVAIGRLIEESAVLRPEARRIRPLGRGFEPLLHERLQRRFSLLPDRPEYLNSLHRHCMLLLEEPAEAVTAIENEMGVILDEGMKRWLDVERRAATLRFVRRDKTEEGQVRWFVRADEQHDVVLDRLGVRGHWLVYGDADAAALSRVATAVERVVTPGRVPVSGIPEGWRIVTLTPQSSDSASSSDLALPRCGPIVGAESVAWYQVPASLAAVGATHLRSKVRRSLDIACARGTAEAVADLLNAFGGPMSAVGQANDAAFVLTVEGDRLRLMADHSELPSRVVADVALGATDPDELMRFLDAVECVADITRPVDQIDERYACHESVVWARALLRHLSDTSDKQTADLAGQHVRLVYIPSSIPHQLGGVPLVGLEFLRDRLEYEGARVHILKLPQSDFSHRLRELLGADIIGIGVYIHNRDEVADLVALLRASGYQGKIILGGPELRNIDAVQSNIDGWDAIIRGEAEDTLPAVLEILRHFDAGRWSEGINRARLLHGVALRCGDAMLLCDTAARNRATNIICPLPFDWARGKSRRRLQMNFTRGCPYLCTFCPNHQGRRFRPGSPDELWRYTLFAIADDVPLPPQIAAAAAGAIQAELGVGNVAPNLPVALHVLLKSATGRAGLAKALAFLRSEIDSDLLDDADALDKLVGSRQTLAGAMVQPSAAPHTAWMTKETWLIAKVAILATRLRHADGSKAAAGTDPQRNPAFVLETSEDNTLVNRSAIADYLRRRTKYGLDEYFVFNPGQNTIWDLTDKKGSPDEDYIDTLVDRNPFAVALGADGTSNPVIRQNHKPFYGVRELLAVNRALARRGITVANNYILLTPETDLFEAVEAFVLFLVLPVPWRDYGEAINLRVIKEELTLSTDEGLLFAPRDRGFDVPLRFDEVETLLDRWSLSSSIPARELEPLLWRILDEDPQASALLPLVVDRWAADFDADPELVAIARLVRSMSRPQVPLVVTLKAVKNSLATTMQNP